jgi:hypothetical protein
MGQDSSFFCEKICLRTTKKKKEILVNVSSHIFGTNGATHKPHTRMNCSLANMKDTELDFKVKEFCVAFACAVTEPSSDTDALIAKNGDESIFSLLQRIFPEVRFRNVLQRVDMYSFIKKEKLLAHTFFAGVQSRTHSRSLQKKNFSSGI